MTFLFCSLGNSNSLNAEKEFAFVIGVGFSFLNLSEKGWLFFVIWKIYPLAIID